MRIIQCFLPRLLYLPLLDTLAAQLDWSPHYLKPCLTLWQNSPRVIISISYQLLYNNIVFSIIMVHPYWSYFYRATFLILGILLSLFIAHCVPTDTQCWPGLYGLDVQYNFELLKCDSIFFNCTLLYRLVPCEHLLTLANFNVASLNVTPVWMHL